LHEMDTHQGASWLGNHIISRLSVDNGFAIEESTLLRHSSAQLLIRHLKTIRGTEKTDFVFSAHFRQVKSFVSIPNQFYHVSCVNGKTGYT
jgi:hypothetical protein